ncbi:hypothetical protein FLK61_38635 [Paenalkalicoccus suaedae]|uniref:Tetratricopeptide repeat protein n=1 Tax=Paenalkalicoccus suaedae TaxID=2592382 RepID=A0A859FI85_9BACI|nr:hypothetical protein [Paenalkalicoccus suaedae]QKS72540.1 hypothetical protein FLK61_38635 [Paenalkalicoccus suaedae]
MKKVLLTLGIVVAVITGFFLLQSESREQISSGAEAQNDITNEVTNDITNEVTNDITHTEANETTDTEVEDIEPLSSQEIESQVDRALEVIAYKDFESVIEILEPVLAADENHQLANELMGHALFFVDDYEQALVHFERLEERSLNLVKAMAELSYLSGDVEKASGYADTAEAEFNAIMEGEGFESRGIEAVNSIWVSAFPALISEGLSLEDMIDVIGIFEAPTRLVLFEELAADTSNYHVIGERGFIDMAMLEASRHDFVAAKRLMEQFHDFAQVDSPLLYIDFLSWASGENNGTTHTYLGEAWNEFWNGDRELAIQSLEEKLVEDDDLYGFPINVDLHVHALFFMNLLDENTEATEAYYVKYTEEMEDQQIDYTSWYNLQPSVHLAYEEWQR